MPSTNDLHAVTIAITKQCNLACTWCFESAGFGERMMAKDAVLKVMADLRTLPVLRVVTFTGGEPLMHPDFLELVQAATETGARSLHVTSNGALVDESLIRQLKGRRVSFGVSVDGREGTHDGIRGRGTFRLALRAIRRLSAAGISVGTSTTLSKTNLNEIDEIADIVAANGATSIMFQRMRNVGSGAPLTALVLDADENRRVAEMILALRERYASRSIFVGYKDPYLNTIDQEFLETAARRGERVVSGGCRVGMSYLFVDVDGEVFPCPFLQVSCGNAIASDIQAIWTTSAYLQSFRSRVNYSACSGCDKWNVCRGCRAEAAVHSGDAFGRDPGCWRGAHA